MARGGKSSMPSSSPALPNSQAADQTWLQIAEPTSDPGNKKRRVVRNGAPARDLALSAAVGGNDELFPTVLSLYVADGSTVADITFGRGVFWCNIPEGRYRLLATDLRDGVDSRSLPYDNESIDCVVFDPPYMHSPGGTAHQKHQPFENYYRNNGSGNRTSAKYHEAVVALYNETGKEAFRVLRKRGVMIVKCQDEVCSNRQRFTLVEIIQGYADLGFIAEDLFVLVRRNRPGVSRVVKQVHARKNHSYFLVFWKPDPRRNAIWTPPR